MTKRDARCGTDANPASEARIQLRALGVDCDEWPDDMVLGYQRALREAELEHREDIQ